MSLIQTQFRGRQISNEITLSANNTTASETIFTVTGAVHIAAIWGELSSAMGANHTGGFLRLNDSTAQVDITASGVTLSGLASGTIISKIGLAAAALTLDSNAAGVISEPASAGQLLFSPLLVVAKTGVSTVIEYRYTTTDTPTSGSINWFAIYEPVSSNGALS